MSRRTRTPTTIDRRKVMALRRAAPVVPTAHRHKPLLPASPVEAWCPLVDWRSPELARPLPTVTGAAALVIRGRNGSACDAPIDADPAEFVEWAQRNGVVKRIAVNGPDDAVEVAMLARSERLHCDFQLPPVGAVALEEAIDRLRSHDPLLFDGILALELEAAQRLKR